MVSIACLDQLCCVTNIPNILWIKQVIRLSLPVLGEHSWAAVALGPQGTAIRCHLEME